MLSKTKVHYGWYICLASFLMMFCTYGLAVNVFSIFLPHIITETNLSKAEGSSIFTVQNVAILLAMLLAGKYYKKLGLRYGSSLAILFIAIGYFIYANAHSLYAFYFGASLVGFGYGMGSMIPISILLNNWFNDKRAFALGLAASGSSFSALIMPTPLTILMETYNLYVSFFVQGILVLIISIILFIVIRDTPAECNLTPYQNGKSTKNNYVILDKKNDMHGGSYVMALIALFIFGGVSMGSFAHFAVHYSNLGYSNIIVSAAASVLGLVLIGGKCLFGIITDRIGSLKSTYIFTAVWMFGFFSYSKCRNQRLCTFPLSNNNRLKRIARQYGTYSLGAIIIFKEKSDSYNQPFSNSNYGRRNYLYTTAWDNSRLYRFLFSRLHLIYPNASDCSCID